MVYNTETLGLLCCMGMRWFAGWWFIFWCLASKQADNTDELSRDGTKINVLVTFINHTICRVCRIARYVHQVQSATEVHHLHIVNQVQSATECDKHRTEVVLVTFITT